MVKSDKSSLLKKLEILEKRVGNTPLIPLKGIIGLYVKLEAEQLGNSIKIRPAMNIIKRAIKDQNINEKTTIIESSSGNFGIALATCAKFLSLRFVAVIDINTPIEKKRMLELLSDELIVVDQRDAFGGYLVSRINFVKGFIKNHSNCYHPNQYENKANPESYFIGLGPEIYRDMKQLDLVFISVSTGGTLAGLSRYLKLQYPNIKVIAVDVQGSQVFQNKPYNRRLSGIGSSIKSKHLSSAAIDYIEILTEDEVKQGCKELMANEVIFGGASTGAVYTVASKYMNLYPNKIGLFISPDDGRSYIEEVYEKTNKESSKSKEQN